MEAAVEFENVHNYFEHLVFNQVRKQLQDVSQDFCEDVACVALNSLPPRYVRQSVDLLFYMSIEESTEMEGRVEAAVAQAIEYVSTRMRDREGI